MTAPSTDKRAAALEAFRAMIGLPVVTVTRAGQDRTTMRYTFTLEDGRELRVDDKTLWSRIEFRRDAVSKLKARPAPVTGDDQKEANARWTLAIEGLILHGVIDDDDASQPYVDTVRDWLTYYQHTATSDRDGAAAAGAPFIEDGRLHITAGGLAKYIRREQVEAVKLTDLYQALRDLGFTRTAVHFRRSGRGRDDGVRSSASYYSAAISAPKAP